MIDRATVEKILDATEIVDVISDFVTLKRRGANYIACCPFHNEKTPSFSVSPSKGIFKCFGCGKAGSAVTFVMEHEQMTYPEALKYLARKESAEDTADRLKRESMIAVSEFASRFYADALFNTAEGHSVGLSYFRQKRGFSDETIRKFGLGWSPSGRCRTVIRRNTCFPPASATSMEGNWWTNSGRGSFSRYTPSAAG